jgi:hypothetical protein
MRAEFCWERKKDRKMKRKIKNRQAAREINSIIDR